MPLPGPLAKEAALYMVALPIGHTDDVTLRALAVLRDVDRIVCEDTRTTARLLARFGMPGGRERLVSFRPTRRDADTERALDFLRSGERVAFTSEAGTPAISDPGSFLVRRVREELPSVPVVAVPGASAIAAALSVAGFQTNPTLYLGFPSPKSARRRSLFERHGDFGGVLVVYESVHRVRACLEDLRARFPDREILVARELTKQHEEIAVWRPEEPFPGHLTLKGEFTLLVGPER